MPRRPQGQRRRPDGLAAWIERTVHLPQGLAAKPGRVKLWPWQREIANAISDPACERVTLLKPTRVVAHQRLASLIATTLVCSATMPCTCAAQRRSASVTLAR
jgi:hypothetical protein